MKKKNLYKTLMISLPLIALFIPYQVHAQLIPQPWVSVGEKDGDITYSVGARFAGLGAELGTGAKGATGLDVLKFINLPKISPYIGVGIYSGNETFAYSGGVQIGVSSRLNLGVGYNSIRGINGQIGIRF